jgi:hypothetical protein
MLPMQLWIIELRLWWLCAFRQMREQFLIPSEQRINDTSHLARQPPNDFLPTDQSARAYSE